MKVRNESGDIVEIPEPTAISPMRHVSPGESIRPYHQWPEVTVTQRGFAQADYYDAAYFYGGKIYFPL